MRQRALRSVESVCVASYLERCARVRRERPVLLRGAEVARFRPVPLASSSPWHYAGEDARSSKSHAVLRRAPRGWRSRRRGTALLFHRFLLPFLLLASLFLFSLFFTLKNKNVKQAIKGACWLRLWLWLWLWMCLWLWLWLCLWLWL